MSQSLDRNQFNRIIDQGTTRSQRMLTAEQLANAANMDKALPRPPLPTEPVVTDPFAYSDDEQ